MKRSLMVLSALFLFAISCFAQNSSQEKWKQPFPRTYFVLDLLGGSLYPDTSVDPTGGVFSPPLKSIELGISFNGVIGFLQNDYVPIVLRAYFDLYGGKGTNDFFETTRKTFGTSLSLDVGIDTYIPEGLPIRLFAYTGPHLDLFSNSFTNVGPNDTPAELDMFLTMNFTLGIQYVFRSGLGIGLRMDGPPLQHGNSSLMLFSSYKL